MLETDLHKVDEIYSRPIEDESCETYDLKTALFELGWYLMYIPFQMFIRRRTSLYRKSLAYLETCCILYAQIRLVSGISLPVRIEHVLSLKYVMITVFWKHLQILKYFKLKFHTWTALAVHMIRERILYPGNIQIYLKNVSMNSI